MLWSIRDNYAYKPLQNMIRKLMSSKEHDKAGGHSKRNYEVQRIETFSDGVFAFAVTLLIVSLEVPKNFEELMTTMRGFFAFGISFLLLIFIWNEQHNFFRRYGLEDPWTLFLNFVLLFIVLFYVYPLKFLFTLVFNDQIYGEGNSPIKITQQQAPALMQIYAVGYIVIYVLFLGMYYHALRKADRLKLSAIEIFDCRTSMYKQVLLISIGCASLFISTFLPPNHFGFAGIIFALIGPSLTIMYWIRGKRKKARFGKLEIRTEG
jgi:uncharacterized membrane protein